MSSWDDEIKQVGAIQIAGGLNKSLFIKGSGDSQVITYQGAPKSLTGDVDVPAAALLNGLILADGDVGGQTLTLVTAAVVAAYINAANVSRSSSLLQVGSSFDFFIHNASTNEGANVGIQGGATYVGSQVIFPSDSAHYRYRFTDVTVGAEVASIYRLAA